MIGSSFNNWAKIKVHDHFILWGIFASVSNQSYLKLAITERKQSTGLVVWQRDHGDYVNGDGRIEAATKIVDKLERLWPCHFLAKEYRGVPHDLSND